MASAGIVQGRDGLIDQGSRVFLGSLISASLYLVCWTLNRQSGERAKLDKVEEERQRLYAARAALDLEAARLCQESEENDRKREEHAQAERESVRNELEAERAAMNLELEERMAAIRAQAYARGILHGERGFMDEPAGIVIHLPRKAAGIDASGNTPRAREH
jgi:hypothetical protein